MSEEFPVEYKGYKIYQVFKKIGTERNPLSGSAYIYEPTNRVCISGGKMVRRTFCSIKAAKDQIDFYVKFFPEDTPKY